MPSGAVRGLGIALTVLGILLFGYAVAAAFGKGHIGDKQAWTPDAVSILVGWFLLMLGPALAFGETPASVQAEVERVRSRR